MTQLQHEPDRTITTAISEKRAAFLTAEGIPLTFETRVVKYESGVLQIESNIPPTMITAFLKAPSYQLQLDMLRFGSGRLIPCGATFKMEFESNSKVQETRTSVRRFLGPNQHMTAEIRNPLDPDTILQKRILDLSDKGMSIHSQNNSLLYPQGRRFDEIKIVFEGQIERTEAGEVVYTRSLMDRNQNILNQIGLKFIDK